MKKTSCSLFICVFLNSLAFAQATIQYTHFKHFQQILAAAGIDFYFPRDFKEIKPEADVNYALEIPNADFQVWYMVKTPLSDQTKIKLTEDSPTKRPLFFADSAYLTTAKTMAYKLAGKGNFISKDLPADVLEQFHADAGRSYQLNLFDSPATSHYQYGLIIALQKAGAGSVAIIFMGNGNGSEFYKNVSHAYYSVKFN